MTFIFNALKLVIGYMININIDRLAGATDEASKIYKVSYFSFQYDDK